MKKYIKPEAETTQFETESLMNIMPASVGGTTEQLPGNPQDDVVAGDTGRRWGNLWTE